MGQKKKSVNLKHSEILRIINLLESSDKKWKCDSKLLGKLKIAESTSVEKYNEVNNRLPTSVITLAAITAIMSDG